MARCRDVQRARYAALSVETRTNAEADGAVLEKVATPDSNGQKLLTDAVDRLKLSARGYHQVLRVARTLDGVDGVGRLHTAEALSYRRIALTGGLQLALCPVGRQNARYWRLIEKFTVSEVAQRRGYRQPPTNIDLWLFWATTV